MLEPSSREPLILRVAVSSGAAVPGAGDRPPVHVISEGEGVD
jgi:hypothetical protein